MSPVDGSAIPIGKFPGAVGRASSYDIQRGGYTSVPDVLQQTVPGAILQDAQGNVFQRDLQYRGFEASPVNGVPQGLAVYQNGVRINEAFGDIVNWDFLPDNAIDGITIIGANPVFGLNALGGAVTIQMRDGFNYQGAELDVRGGSFGRYQGALTYGANNGSWAAFMALEGIHDDGFRDFTKSMIRRMLRRSRREGRRHRVPPELHRRRQLRRRDRRGTGPASRLRAGAARSPRRRRP